ncbi:hypothetical protein E2C01_009760 [Portunus trituberculatus]|uniref:Uncharacterized protein n=1 Tax=Portunus trituberculatus TaxID=210409 RepID=A0A5B7D6L3_PORTR|nr:hypothetical protein [Portunus trituberculatus]
MTVVNVSSAPPHRHHHHLTITYQSTLHHAASSFHSSITKYIKLKTESRQVATRLKHETAVPRRATIPPGQVACGVQLTLLLRPLPFWKLIL